MARTNYSYEKRQREIAKKKKQEEKRQRKLEKAAGTSDGSDAVQPDQARSDTDSA